MKLRVLLLRMLILIVCAGVPAAAAAQTLPPPPTGPVEDPAETAKIRLGPLFMQPNFSLHDVGRDNNVYQDPANPVQDWTATVNMGMLAGLRYGPARLTVRTSSDYVWFANEKTERSIDGNTRTQFEIRNDRLRPWIAMERVKTHARAGLEIDTRAGRQLPVYEAGLEFRPGFRLGTRLMVRQRNVEYEDQEEFRGVKLADALNAQYQDLSLQVLYEISSLSAFRVIGEMSRARFDTASVRDANDWAAFVGLEGKKGAAMEGFIDVGWRDRQPQTAGAPSYAGLIARAQASVILFEEVLWAFGADRDLLWSFEEAYSFYVQQGGATTLTWRPHDRFELFGTGRHYWMEYDEGLTGAAVLRTDKVYSYGGGIGFFLRGYPGTRLGLVVERQVRESILEDRRYDTPRFFTTVGFSF